MTRHRFLCSNHIKRALEIYDETGNYEQEYGYTLSALGSSYRYLGQYTQAEDCLKKALKIFRSVHSPSKLRVINRVTELHLLVISSNTTITINVSTSKRNKKIPYKYVKLSARKGSKCFYSCAAVVSVCMDSCMFASQVKTRLSLCLLLQLT